MTQQLSLFDFGEDPKPKSRGKKSTTTKADTPEPAEALLSDDVIAETLQQQEVENLVPAPLSFTFFIAEITAGSQSKQKEAHSSKIIFFDEDPVNSEFQSEKIEETDVVEDILAEAEQKEPVTYKPDEKITTTKKRGRKSFKEIDTEVDLISIPGDEELFKKQYYSITEVAGWFRVNNSLLRFWENEFPILKPRKNRKGDRLFRPEDVKNLQIIYYLLRQRKFTIDGARKYLKANKENAEANLKIIQSLNKFKGFLLEIKTNLEQ